ncbi:hypothetical protein B0H34DRAFT_858712 [Crassisporium funariophilum]|nr:hypothetical protein B0H34DRAFT_858712 [Crassisporium funariophilum]
MENQELGNKLLVPKKPSLSVVHCELNLDDLLGEYLSESKALNIKLGPNDYDVGAFHSTFLRQGLKGEAVPPEPLGNTPHKITTNKMKGEKKKFEFPAGNGGAWSSFPDDSSLAGNSTEGASLPGLTLPKNTLAGTTVGTKKKSRRGKKSSETRPRGGAPILAADGDEKVAGERSLLLKWMKKADFHRTAAYSLQENGSRTQPGWNGRNPPPATRLELRRDYSTGKIYETLSRFFPVYYNQGRPAVLLDSESRAFFYRTSQCIWFMLKEVEFYTAVLKLLQATLEDSETKAKFSNAERGPHFPCIIGIDRRYSDKPELTAWHRQNFDAVEEFINTPVIKSVTEWVSSVVNLVFPGVADRFRSSAKWHGITAPFGLFWNLCINGMFEGQRRIHCLPHADSKNIVGVCVLVIYEIPGNKKKFNHSKRTWLVLWEAGVAIELPPWVMAAYPSSLLYHFNVDVSDFKFVTTEGDERPTPENSTPLEEGDGDGRGSLVYFNQAVMYMSSETDSATLKEATKKGHSGKTDYGKAIQDGFEKHGVYRSIQPLAK